MSYNPNRRVDARVARAAIDAQCDAQVCRAARSANQYLRGAIAESEQLRAVAIYHEQRRAEAIARTRFYSEHHAPTHSRRPDVYYEVETLRVSNAPRPVYRPRRPDVVYNVTPCLLVEEIVVPRPVTRPRRSEVVLNAIADLVDDAEDLVEELMVHENAKAVEASRSRGRLHSAPAAGPRDKHW